MFFDSELPEDMTALLDKWRKKTAPLPSPPPNGREFEERL
jgi:hypothetical protein